MAASREKRGGMQRKIILNLFFCSFKSWIDLFFCSKDSWAERICAVCSCRVRACFLWGKIIYCFLLFDRRVRCVLELSILCQMNEIFRPISGGHQWF